MVTTSAKGAVITTGLRRVPRQARSVERVGDIVRAAEELFAARGVEAVTTNAIAERAGVGVGSVYDFFDDREAIAVHLASCYVAELVGVMDAALAQRLDIRGQVALTAASLARFQREHSALGALLAPRADSPSLEAMTTGMRAVVANAIGSFLREVKRGVLPTARITMVTNMLVDLITAMVTRLAAATPRQRTAVLDEWVLVITNYLEGDAFRR
jgi:AcrR family transcriptional regulator